MKKLCLLILLFSTAFYSYGDINKDVMEKKGRIRYLTKEQVKKAPSTALRNAIQYDDIIEVAALLQYGFNVEESGGSWTPLFYAALNKNKDIVTLLLNKGAKVNAKNSKGNTPLSKAHYSPKITQLLLEHGATATKEDIKSLEEDFLYHKKLKDKWVKVLKKTLLIREPSFFKRTWIHLTH